MKSTEERTKIAEKAINLLRDGVINKDSEKIIDAYFIVEDPYFGWDYLDSLHSEWSDLTEQANDII